MDTKMIGDVSKEHREELGLSITDVSTIINKHISNIYRFENGGHKDPKGYILAYATLGNSQEYLSKVLPLISEEGINA